jgi:hypothetical protein
MTLVITEASERYGCVVVGDTAVTIKRKNSVAEDVERGVRKVHYADKANIGFAIWGNACLAGRRLDELVSEFVDSLTNAETPRSAGKSLAETLRGLGHKDGRPWQKLRGGVHVCGYQDGKPVIFHVHTGPEWPAPQTPFQLYEDFPDASGGGHLRNGHYEMFSVLFEAMQRYAAGLRGLGFKWPESSVDDRVSYYTIMVETVGRTLEAAGRVPKVSDLVCAFAFNRNGIQVWKMPQLGPMRDFCKEAGNMAYFSEPNNPGMI